MGAVKLRTATRQIGHLLYLLENLAGGNRILEALLAVTETLTLRVIDSPRMSSSGDY
jgi:hypothetical protein